MGGALPLGAWPHSLAAPSRAGESIPSSAILARRSVVVGRGVTFTTIHMPLVKTPMIAPTKMYDAFPTLTPDEAANMVCEALRSKPKEINTRLGTFGQVAYALMPKAVDQILHLAYKVFPDSAAAKGQRDPDEKASMEQLAMANLMKGVHW